MLEHDEKLYDCHYDDDDLQPIHNTLMAKYCTRKKQSSLTMWRGAGSRKANRQSNRLTFL